jgi:predicted kinase
MRLSTARDREDIARSRTLALTSDDVNRLDALCPAARVLRRDTFPRHTRPTRPGAEIVLVMGLPGAGKTTMARDWAARGYLRLNRDDTGGSLRSLVPEIDRALDSGASRLVLDNTYISRKSRAPVLAAAAARGISVRCVWLSTSLEDAQVNATSRMAEVQTRRRPGMSSKSPRLSVQRMAPWCMAAAAMAMSISRPRGRDRRR